MRNSLIDSLKGCAAFLVIVGHAVQRSFPEYLDVTIFKVIYSFHMPLFMLLSGYVLHSSQKKFDWEWLSSKIPRLILPFFAWYIIYWFASVLDFTGLRPYLDFSGSMLDYIIRGVNNPNNGPWFLWALFVCYIAFFLSHKLIPKFGVFYAILIVYVLGRAVPVHGFGFEYIKTMFPFFAFGYMFVHYKDRLGQYHKHFLIFSVVLFPILSVNWFSDFNLPQQLRFVVSLLKIIIPLMGILLSYHLMLLIKDTKIFSVFAYIGTFSLELYVCQGLFLNVGIGDGYQRVITITIAATLLSYLLMLAINKIDLFRYVLFGKNISIQKREAISK